MTEGDLDKKSQKSKHLFQKFEAKLFSLRRSIFNEKKKSEPADSTQIHTLVVECENPFDGGIMFFYLKDSGECIPFFQKREQYSLCFQTNRDPFKTWTKELISLCNEIDTTTIMDLSTFPSSDGINVFFISNNERVESILPPSKCLYGKSKTSKWSIIRQRIDDLKAKIIECLPVDIKALDKHVQ